MIKAYSKIAALSNINLASIFRFQSVRTCGSVTSKYKETILKLDGYSIRRAVKEDCGVIHQFVQELANSINMPNGPQIDVKTLEEDGFGSRRLYEGFIAESDELKEIVGCATYYFTYSTWYGKSLYMEDMFIKPEHRKNRIAVSFFHLVSQAALRENCMSFNFVVLKNNKLASHLFQSLGAVDLTAKEGWHSYCISRGNIEELAQATFLNSVKH